MLWLLIDSHSPCNILQLSPMFFLLPIPICLHVPDKPRLPLQRGVSSRSGRLQLAAVREKNEKNSLLKIERDKCPKLLHHRYLYVEIQLSTNFQPITWCRWFQEFWLKWVSQTRGVRPRRKPPIQSHSAVKSTVLRIQYCIPWSCAIFSEKRRSILQDWQRLELISCPEIWTVFDREYLYPHSFLPLFHVTTDRKCCNLQVCKILWRNTLCIKRSMLPSFADELDKDEESDGLLEPLL